MNETIIRQHNERVKPDDTVYFVGDFCFRNSAGGKEGEGELHKAEYYRHQLNGQFVFIKGNHDRNNSLKTPIEKLVIRYGGHRINLCHNPIHADPTYPLNFVGHIHGAWKIKRLNENSIMVNVGVDVWNFKPISYEEIWSAIQRWKKTEIT